MGFLGSLVRGLLKVFCVSSPEQEPPEPVFTGVGRPPYPQQTQQLGDYLTQHQYPPSQQQQQQQQQQPWRPPLPPRPPPEPAYSQQPPQQYDQLGESPHAARRKRRHSQGQGHHVQGQSQGPFQGPSRLPSPPPAPQNQWTSSPSSPPQPQAVLVHPTSPRPTPGRTDQKFINSQNEYFVSLRARANEEGDAMARSFEQSHAAYARNDKAVAKELSNEGKAHQKEMERLNAEASAWIFNGEVDLHGLYVKEAVAYTDNAIAGAQARGDKEIRLIVGKGTHSLNHEAKVKPAIEELMQITDPQNSGVLIVQLEGGTAVGRSRN
ncbi:hypothetical protein BJV74DRAFT_830603 [Russula compacta]|nr:hypothetical protein BJV74DRAFT_830603 [Russula compacta]